jgi:transposase
MPKLSLYARQRIVTLYFTKGVNVTNIAKLLKEEGIKVSRSAVSLFVSRYKKSGSLQDANRSGRKSKITDEHLNFIDNKMKENDELTSKELQEQLLEEHNIQLSVSSIRRVKRNVLGWKSENARYCQFVREPNKMKRLIFCLSALVNKDTFEDVIFTDETSVQIEQHARICFRKKGSQPKRKGRPKHPVKVRNFET